ncbi:MAG TPA: hypothetical protein ENN07_02975 [candidate division Zixibacteria bacterium]|nr:hypothetical protein [candidate division Zixibacteria bacterium]
MDKESKQLPLDFRWQAVIPVYALALFVVFFFGKDAGAYQPYSIYALILGFLAGLPGSKWELTAIMSKWDEIIAGPAVSFRVGYYKHKEAKKKTQYSLAVSFLIPLIFLLMAYMFYFSKMLASVSFGWALLLLIKWNGWYWFPYIFGLQFSSTHLPRLIAVASFGKKPLPDILRKDEDA